jgi:alkanesulfonate monooxygenase SsuD/methylene tetrahydromethanopterin reductase-like flavin-dependent oxidoreductase (luciferase family)
MVAGGSGGGPARAGLPALALTMPQFSVRPEVSLAACRDAQRLGFAGAFVFDHLWPIGPDRTRPALECWTLLAALAAAAKPEGSGGPRGGAPEDREGSGEPQGGAPVGRDRFRVGTLVTRAGLRAPALVARMAATVGQAAGAPPIVAVGRGDPVNRDENLAYGLPYPDAATRAADLEATVAALRGPQAGDPRPPVWVGGVGPVARELAGRLADAWNGWGRTPEELAGGLADVRQAAERAGRDPARVAGTWGGQVLVAPDRGEAEAALVRWRAGRQPAEVARVLAGDPETVMARLRALHDAGAACCVLAPVGAPGAGQRALLAAAAGLPRRG